MSTTRAPLVVRLGGHAKTYLKYNLCHQIVLEFFPVLSRCLLLVPKVLLLSQFGFSIGLSSVRVTALMMDLVVWRTGNDDGVSHFTEPHLDALPWLWD